MNPSIFSSAFLAAAIEMIAGGLVRALLPLPVIGVTARSLRAAILRERR